MIVEVLIVVQLALYAQPDAKIANGVYWTQFWLDVAAKILG